MTVFMNFESLAILYKKWGGFLPVVFLIKHSSYPVREQRQCDTGIMNMRNARNSMPGIMNNR